MTLVTVPCDGSHNCAHLAWLLSQFLWPQTNLKTTELFCRLMTVLPCLSRNVKCS
jgi:hypothetical protein